MNQQTTKKDYQAKLLIFVVATAFLLRVWGIWNATSTDEYNEVFEALRVCSGNLNYERWFKRFYLYILAFEYGVYYVIGLILDVYQSPGDFAIKIVRNMEPLFLMGRMTSVLFGTASVFMTYMVGKVLFNRIAGLLAALFLCFNVVNIELSHYARVDASLCFLTLTTFYFIAKILKSHEQSLTKWYFLAGIFFGCALQNKPQAIVLIIPLIFVHFGSVRIKDFFKSIFEKYVFYCIIGFSLGLIIGNPAIFFAPGKFIMSFLGLSKAYTTPVNETRSEHIGFIVYGIYFFKELGVLLSVAAAFSIMQSFFNRQKETILLFSFMVPFFLLMGSSRYMVSYSYMIPFMPFLYLLTANCLHQTVAKRFTDPKVHQVLWLLAICLLIQPALHVYKYERSMTGPNTRILAKKWIEANIPYGSKILMDSGKTINSFSPQIAMNEQSLKRLLAAKKHAIEQGALNDITKMVDEKSLVYFEMLLKTVPKESYDITSTGFGLEVQSLAFYIENQFEYFIVSSELKRSRTEPFFAKQYPEIADFYRSLDRDDRARLIHYIAPSQKNKGDKFYIYKLEKNGSG